MHMSTRKLSTSPTNILSTTSLPPNNNNYNNNNNNNNIFVTLSLPLFYAYLPYLSSLPFSIIPSFSFPTTFLPLPLPLSLSHTQNASASAFVSHIQHLHPQDPPPTSPDSAHQTRPPSKQLHQTHPGPAPPAPPRLFHHSISPRLGSPPPLSSLVSPRAILCNAPG